jgi:hypothetical protein
MVYEPVANKEYAKYKSGEELFLIISSAKMNSISDSLLVAPVCEYKSDIIMNPYRISYNITRGYEQVTYIIMLDRMFRVSERRLNRYRYSLLPNTMEKIKGIIIDIFFSEKLYTETEALGLAFKTMMKSNGITTETHTEDTEMEYIDHPIKDMKPLTRAEEEYQFAMSQEAKYVEEEEDVLEATPMVEDKPVVEEQQESTRVANKDKYRYIYDNYETFLDDYQKLSTTEMMEKYNIPKKRAVYDIAYNCKSLSKNKKKVLLQYYPIFLLPKYVSHFTFVAPIEQVSKNNLMFSILVFDLLIYNIALPNLNNNFSLVSASYYNTYQTTIIQIYPSPSLSDFYNSPIE